MTISFDPAKDATNLQKHGVSLLLAEKIRWDEVWCAPDTRMDYGELREIGFAMVGARLYVVVFCSARRRDADRQLAQSQFTRGKVVCRIAMSRKNP